MKEKRKQSTIITSIFGVLILLLGGCWPFSSEKDLVGQQVLQDPQPNAPLLLEQKQQKPAREIVFEEPDPPLPPPELEILPAPPCDPPKAKSSPTTKPRIAIIIDDMGHHKTLGDALLDLDLNLTFSFLPHAPFTAEQEEKAYQLGRGILLHQPMEPRDSKWDPGQGAVMLTDSPQVINQTILDNLTHVPHAKGLNNHMGSLFTEDREAMQQVLTLVQAKHLFFIDSFTTANSTGLDEARRMGIKSARRHVFLDNVHLQANICRQLEKLILTARQQGYAIGIGHPNQATLSALTQCRKQLLESVEVVDAQELIR
jgi:polysaccharide deacetylase 2 family uncharacterized protein YibQ